MSAHARQAYRHPGRRRPRPRDQQRHRRRDDPRVPLRLEVVGIHDGFRWLMKGDIVARDAAHRSPTRAASISAAARTSASRARTPRRIRSSSRTPSTRCMRLGVDKLITIGGDDTGFSAHQPGRGLAAASSASCTCRRRSTTISISRTTSTPSASRPRGTSASRSSRT